jgi:hypothetical protein
MARGTALAGSLVVHGAIAAALGLCVATLPPRSSGAPNSRVDIEIDIEIVAGAPAADPPAPSAPPLAAPSSVAPSASSSASPPSSPSSRPPGPDRPARGQQAPGRQAVATDAVETTLRMDTDGAENGRAGETRELGETGDSAGGAGGTAAQVGRGPGRGIGFGAGGGIASGGEVASLGVPPAPHASLARPPRLVYPTREAETDESILFVARLTIDSDGYVVGARIVRGHGMTLDDEAERAVWRFRFRPALDDDGRPVRATIEQSFMVD